MSHHMTALIASWQALRTELSDPAYRRDVCFICEIRPVQVRAPGVPVGVCRPCDIAAAKEEETTP